MPTQTVVRTQTLWDNEHRRAVQNTLGVAYQSVNPTKAFELA